MTRFLLGGLLTVLVLGVGCQESGTKRPGRCVSKTGQEIPCDELERPDPNAPRPPVRKARVRPVVEPPPDLGEREDELERITGDDSRAIGPMAADGESSC